MILNTSLLLILRLSRHVPALKDLQIAVNLHFIFPSCRHVPHSWFPASMADPSLTSLLTASRAGSWSWIFEFFEWNLNRMNRIFVCTIQRLLASDSSDSKLSKLDLKDSLNQPWILDQKYMIWQHFPCTQFDSTSPYSTCESLQNNPYALCV
jgi:hypothetical protein